MDYQLVLQFPLPAEQTDNLFLTLEDDLVEHLEDSADVEGHDAGEAAVHLFITTGTPARTFERLRPLLVSRALLDRVTAAYRHVDEEDYRVIWPKDDSRPFVAP
ncbi:MAG: hypothetical protein RJA22_224 [Verrucomicrobiota bacterium]|jgi:hypothetical protein